MLKEQLRVVYGLKQAIPKDENGVPTDNKSEVEMVVSDAIQNRRVDFNLRGLAGHEAGIEQLPDGTTYMIERSGRWVEPVKRRLGANRATHQWHVPSRSGRIYPGKSVHLGARPLSA